MDITSVTYIVFVAVSLCIYWIMPTKFQWIVLLVDSLLFYFLNAETYTFIYLCFSVFSVWLATLVFEKIEEGRVKKMILFVVIMLNIGLLAILKYMNLVLNTISWVTMHMSGFRLKTVSWATPLAISFYTLQIVAYILNAYWKTTVIEKNPFRLLLFTSYFPLMVSGPICSYDILGKELFEEHRFDYDRVTNGMKRIAWGLLKKMALSNRIALIVDALWDNVEIYHGLWIWIAALGYAFQLYTDFSGCMDIIIGVSQCFGIHLPENFKAPFYSKTIQEFWQRWHISLGQWLRDYIMNPLLKTNLMFSIGQWSKKKLGKKKGKRIPVYLSMLVLWLSMGLWHGNSWKYIIGEGLWFWFAMTLGQILEPCFERWKEKLHIKDGKLFSTLQVMRTIGVFAVGMLFFRSSSMSVSIQRVGLSFSFGISLASLKSALTDCIQPLGKAGGVMLGVSFLMLTVYDFYLYRGNNLLLWLNKQKCLIRWFIYVLVIAIILLSYHVTNTNFAYAQF